MTLSEQARGTTNPSRPGSAELTWLRQAAGPGQRSFRLAVAWTVAATAAGVAQWGALAWLVSTGLTGASAFGGRPWAVVALLVLAVAARAAATGRARACARRGGAAITSHLRAALLDAALPDAPQPGTPQPGTPQPGTPQPGTPQPGAIRPGTPWPGGEAAATAHSVVDLSADVAAYHERTWPARAAAGPASVLVLICVAIIHWPAAVLLALSTPILPVNMHLAGMATDAASRRQLDAVRSLSAQLLDRFRGMHVLRSLDAVGREGRTVERACDDLNRTTMSVLRRAFVSSAVMDLVVTFAIAVTATYVGLTLLGYIHLFGAPRLDLFRGLFVLLLAPAYFAPLREYASGYHERDRALAAAEILGPLLAGDAVGSATDARRARSAGGTRPRRPLARAPRIELAQVQLRFPGAERPLLEDITATAEPGRLTVLSAPSGAGKSTLLAIIGGLLFPTAGHVSWVDPDTETGAGPEPGRASWLGQNTVIVAGTIADNIRLGDPAAGGAAVARAARDAGLGPLLAGWPAGLDTPVGDHGLGLSAGQARRVALARTLLRDAALWILDEPTAHLDAASEADMVGALLRAGAGRTVIIATHSAAVIERADVLWRLDAGRLLSEVGALR
jgi:ATP-binding cassette, subfamily C, bacterial CydD